MNHSFSSSAFAWAHRLVLGGSVLALCTAGAGAAVPLADPGRATPPRVALVLTSLRDSWNAQFAELCRDSALASGFDLSVYGCTREGQVEWQESFVDTVAAGAFHGLILLPADSVRMVRSCRQAMAKGVAVVVVVNPLDADEMASAGMSVPFVGCDDTRAGKLLGAFLKTRFPAARNGLVLETGDANRAGQRRVDGFFLEFAGGAQRDPHTARVLAHGQRDEAFLIATRAVAEQPLQFVFSANDEMALGAADAVTAPGQRPVVMGIGNTDQAKARLRTGQMQATVDLRADLVADAAMSAMRLRLTGRTAPPVTEIAPELITFDSVGKRVWLLLHDQAQPSLAQLATGVKHHAARHGMLLQTANAANDRVVQERQVRTVVQGKSDFLIVDPLDVAGLRHELHAAVVSGIRLIVVGDFRMQEIAGTAVGVDYAQAGQLAGGILMRLLRGKGAVVEVEGVPGTQVAKELSLGARRGTGDAPGIRWTSRESAYFDRGKARSVITRHLVQNQRMDGIFAHDPAMLLGASESCRAKVPQPQLLPILVGFGYSADAESAVRQGEASAMVYAPAMRWGEICVNTAVRLCRGETPGTFVPVDLTVLEH